MNKKLLILIGISILSILGALVILMLLSNSAVSDQAGRAGLVTITVKGQDDASQPYVLEAVEDEVLLDTLRRLETIDETFTFGFRQDATLGAYIISMNGIEADVTKNEFWKLIINNNDANEGISTYKVKGGDTIVFEIDNY